MNMWELRKIKDFFLREKPRKLVVYTAIFGDYDDLKNQNLNNSKYDLVCFTDNKKIKSKNFKIVFQKPKYKDSNRSAKIYKILPHLFFPNYEYSLWIDGSVIIKRPNLEKIIELYLNERSIALFDHPDRDCVYDEVQACIEAKRDNIEIMIKQVEKYRKEGYPAHNGLAACTIILRRHNNSEIIKLDEDWFSEIEGHSRRDQLSFNYVMWKNKQTYTEMNGILWDNDYFKVLGHKK